MKITEEQQCGMFFHYQHRSDQRKFDLLREYGMESPWFMEPIDEQIRQDVPREEEGEE